MHHYHMYQCKDHYIYFLYKLYFVDSQSLIRILACIQSKGFQETLANKNKHRRYRPHLFRKATESMDCLVRHLKSKLLLSVVQLLNVDIKN